MKEIKLSNWDKPALVDDEDYDKLILMCDNWCKGTSGVKGVNKLDHRPSHKDVMMHRVIMGLHRGDCMTVDHIDFNQLNNQKDNLRVCSKQQNAFHSRKYKNSASKYKGVIWSNERQVWRVKLGFNKREVYGGQFKDEIEAAKKADELMLIHHGEFAMLNFPKDKNDKL